MKTKTLVTVSLILFISILSVFGLLTLNKPATTSVTTPSLVSPSPIPTTITQDITHTILSQHNQPTDCWIAISGTVYNVTDYLNLHPGGPEMIISVCGTDATVAFETQNRQPPQSHRSNAISQINQYRLGPLAK
jgi:cytochrome b involved in lipid metabolism